MKFICLQENLTKAFSFINKITVLKTQLPVTSSVLLKTTEDGIEIVGTDLENTVRMLTPGKPLEKGAALVPIRTITEVINAMPKDQVEVATEGLVTKVKAGSYEAKINGISPDEFPQLPKPERKDAVEIKEILAHMKLIAFAASNDESRAVLNGVFLRFGKDGMQIVATDGFRLSLQTISDSKSELPSLLIPARILFELSKIESERVLLSIESTKNQAVFILGDTTVFTRLIEGEFPNFEKIIPKAHSTKITVDKEELLEAVKLSSIFARESANIIKLKIAKDGLTLSANASQIGENRCDVECSLEGDENDIAFNGRFLLDFLNNSDSKEIAFEMTGPLNPGVFKIPGDDSYLHIIMPVRVQG